MHYDYVAIPDEAVPVAQDPAFQHLLSTYASETNKTASMWSAVPDGTLDFRPDERLRTVRDIMVHQLLSERRFFGQFVDTVEPAPAAILPTPTPQTAQPYIDRYVELAHARLGQFAAATSQWWLDERPFFDVPARQRIWIFWRRVLHTCHHRTQVQTWLRLAGHHVPAIYGPSGDVTWSEADPTDSIEAAGR